MELTFGEQIKVILKRKNMTISMLAEIIEQQTGKAMSRQNLTQKLNRDNFQEQDMREIAQALGCVVQISVIDPMEETVMSLQSLFASGEPEEPAEEPARTGAGVPVYHIPGMTAQEKYTYPVDEDNSRWAEQWNEGSGRALSEFDYSAPYEIPREQEESGDLETWDAAVKRRLESTIRDDVEEKKAKLAREAEMEKLREEPELRVSSVDPKTGLEYETNTVMHHPTKSDMVLVYDRDEHVWIEQAQSAFQHFQIRKRAALGNDYEPPIYID